ncbi:MAG TPA: hypothetical protein VM032_02325 [Vicinamibacterales bacterium]|nr:hypothetical protein [Vicinamibacterales bacterium]
MRGLRVVLATAAGALLPRAASACPVCFGAGDGLLLRGSSMGILALLVVTLAMLGAFAAFFAGLARRAARVDQGNRRGTPPPAVTVIDSGGRR